MCVFAHKLVLPLSTRFQWPTKKIAELIEQLWILIALTPKEIVLVKGDFDLVLHWIRELEQEKILEIEELNYVISYVYEKLTVIRDEFDLRD